MNKDYFILLPLVFVWLMSICGVSYMIAHNGYYDIYADTIDYDTVAYYDVDTFDYAIVDTVEEYYYGSYPDDEVVIDTVAWDWVEVYE